MKRFLFSLNRRSAILALGGFVFLTTPAWAQEATKAAAKEAPLTASVVLPLILAGFLFLIVAGFLVAVFIQALPLLFHFYDNPVRQHSAMARFINLFRGDTTTFTGKANDILMEDHSYDGIHEFDNDLPPWWKFMFYATAVFAVVYLLNFHVFHNGALQTQEYETEMQQAALFHPSGGAGNANEKTDYKVLTDAARIDAGHAAFTQNCAACHGQKGEGVVGPNLTDEYWLHGGEVNEVFKTIKFGVTSKGMVAWQGKLSDDQILEVSSYILSIQGTNPPNAKAPQGEKK
ncbi:cbb3-type cytochrome c oxidase N-terminal domain-containing protein [Adhaeribacter radiodurans]|uniref:C-type cytochrome n=1 Tax=Adhaeribacter radiodurans TaxID=2745197 RepID=A0A7L7L1J6_9BACT|nr:cbb3-type cytochrome c oxidase N-terminal domain-containing protein [Adhaeribacter radiodurans]QMU26657.1 c-type cytochrome [Adhaeribacter radiodurans]